jgi:GT2 family glycosyltransferase
MHTQIYKVVYIIILNWNGLKDTLECVGSCLKLDYPIFEIVIVDNGSDDGSENILRESFPSIRLIQTGANLGYAGGNNAGIRHALEGGADYIWLLNNDTTVDANALTELVKIAETNPSIGMVGSKILSYLQPTVLLYAGGRADLAVGETEHIGYGSEDRGQFDLGGDTGYITGCSLLVKRRVIEETGLMNEAYFLYYEETEWCTKARRKGYRLIYAPESVVYHKESVSVRKTTGVMHYYLTRNRLYFLLQNGVKVRWLKRFGSDLREFLGHVRRKELSSARFMLTAYWHWFTGYRGPLDALTKNSRHGHSR